MGLINPTARFQGREHAQRPPSLAPTSTLPPLRQLATHTTTEQVRQSLHNLRHLYFQPEPAILYSSKISSALCPIGDTPVPDSGYASAEEDELEATSLDFLADAETQLLQKAAESDTEAEPLRTDPFERSFAIKWLTGFIARSDSWIAACNSESDSEERSDVFDQAITLLSAFTCGDEEAEVALTRTFSFPIVTSSIIKKEIHVELNDAPLSKEDHTSVGLQSWGSSILLAERMCIQPSHFSLTVPRPLRVLELGAGTGMLSIVAAKILQSYNPPPEIIATDYHPQVLDNLAKNIVTNFPESPAIIIKHLDWQFPNYSVPLDRPFDIILASDVIYHPDHARWINQCVEKLLARPSTSKILSNDSGGVFWLIIPVRSTGRHEGLDQTVDALFPAYSRECIGDSEPRLTILQKEEVGRQGHVGRADEDSYKLFKIGWAN